MSCDQIVMVVVMMTLFWLSPVAWAEPTTDTAARSPAEPFAHVESGQVGTERTARGIKILSNVPGNRYVLELVGESVTRVRNPKDGGLIPNIWDVDGLLLHVMSLPLAEEADLGHPMALLRAHMRYERDFQAEKGLKEVIPSRDWLSFPTGEPVLYWEMLMPVKEDPPLPTNVTKMMFATTLNGNNVIILAASLLPTVDEVKCKRTLTDSLLTLVRHEKSVGPIWGEVDVALSGNGHLSLLNGDLATRNERKKKGAFILSSEKFIRLVRIAAEVPDRMVCVAFLYDGVSGHCINLAGYDRTTNEFRYYDTLGDQTFLEEANNHAGVNARRSKDSPGRVFLVKETDLQKVLQGISLLQYRCVRHYFVSYDLERSLEEYRELKSKFPESEEWSEAWLLKAGQSLTDIDEDVRAINIYSACYDLHEGSSRALASIASVFAKSGNLDSAANFYDSAIKKLPEDKSLDDAQRKQFAATWGLARRALTATPVK